MKKNKGKSEQKSVKKAERKDTKKAARKELSTHLSARFREVIEGLGHEAEVIAKDIEKAGKLLSKKLSGKKVKQDAANSSLIRTLDSAIEQVREKGGEASAAEVPKAETAKKPRTAATRRRAVAEKAEPADIAPEKKAGRKTAKAETADITPEKRTGRKPTATGTRGRRPGTAQSNRKTAVDDIAKDPAPAAEVPAGQTGAGE